jgi:DNA-binding transcriptional ArsR family regulator
MNRKNQSRSKLRGMDPVAIQERSKVFAFDIGPIPISTLIELNGPGFPRYDPHRAIQMKTFNHPNLDDVPLSNVMQALSDPSRVKIVRTLMGAPDREFSCKEIDLGVAKATVSHHFETLRNAGIIKTRSAGTKRLSSLRTEEFNSRFPGLIKLVAAEG